MTLSAAPVAYARDSTRPPGIVIDGSWQVAMVYVDGDYAWKLEDVARVSDARKHVFRVSCIPGTDPRKASFCDMEAGDYDAAGAAKYVRQRNDLHGDGGLYCDLANVPAVVEALDGERAWLWVASWTPAEPHIPAMDLPGNVHLALVQYRDAGAWDESAVYDKGWLG